jgi:NAD(P)-dependent dehydrogenase (short-subunit alcohol dehydrogenase family)
MSQPTAIITGAGGAIATQVIDTFSKAGWRLAMVAFSDAQRAPLAEEHPHDCIVQANLADDGAARRAIATAVDECGNIDALLNIAGGFDMSDALETTPDQLEVQLDINFRTAFNATRAVLPHMLDNGHGFILGVGAGQALTGGASAGPYAAAKAAMIAWMKSMHAELAPRGIDMAIIYPMGAVDTPGNRQAMPNTDPGTWIDPAEIAATMLHLATRGPRGKVRQAKVYPPV